MLASMAKLKAGRLRREVSDACLQYWGGAGYLWDSPVARAYRDGRLGSIGGGADEVMLQIIATMQMFVEAFILNGGQGANDNTESVVYLIYQYAFAMSSASNFNSAAALGVVLLVVLATFSGGYVWLTRTRDR